MPPMNEATNSISNSTLSVGSSIKVGQVLALIADAQRLGVLLKVHDADINAIHVGEHVMVTGLAFPEQKMLGTIVAVASQAQSPTESAADASLFAVRVEIPRITAEEAQKIRVGMSAQVDIVIHPGVQLMLPLNAVHTEHDQSWVEKKNPKTQRIEKARVRTGMTTATEVSIVQGLQEGDQVRVYE